MSYVDVFGPTQQGVPSPLVPHEHPYPTRYHGPIWNMPRFSRKFAWTPMAVPPYAGMGAADGEPSILGAVFGAAAGGYVSKEFLRGSNGQALASAGVGGVAGYMKGPIMGVLAGIATAIGASMVGSTKGPALGEDWEAEKRRRREGPSCADEEKRNRPVYTAKSWTADGVDVWRKSFATRAVRCGGRWWIQHRGGGGGWFTYPQGEITFSRPTSGEVD
jgi:hypothetical protein